MIHRNLARVGLALCAIGTLLAANNGCSAILVKPSAQCLSEQDCLNRGPDFADSTCDPQTRTCVPLPAEAKLCSTNSECIDRANGAPAVCRKQDHKCAPLTNDFCQKVLAEKSDLLNDESIDIGLVGPADQNYEQQEDAVDLARQEIKATLGGGLPPVSPGGQRRPLVFISCNSEYTDGLAGAQFLANQVQVPTMIGPNISSNMISIAQNITLPANITLMTAVCAAPQISTLSTQNLVWRLSYSEILNHEVVNPFVAQYLEPLIHSNGIAAPSDPTRIMVVHSGDGAGLPSADNLIKILQFNGTDVPTNRTNGNFRSHNFGDPSDHVNNPDPLASWSAAVTDTLDFKPHIVFWIGGPESIPFTFDTVERLWDDASKGRTDANRPIHILVTIGWQSAIIPHIGTDAGLRKRVFGLQSYGIGFDQTQQDDWKEYLKSRYQDLTTQVIANQVLNEYDAAYLTALALIANGANPLTGQTFGAALRKVTSGGTAVQPGSSTIQQAVSVVQKEGAVEFHGISGLAKFDQNGDRSGNPGVYCYNGAPLGGATTGFKSTGFYWDVATQRATGTVTPCSQ